MPAVDGLVTGLDTTALIQAILSTASAKKYTLEAQTEDLRDKLDKIAGIKTRMSELSDLMDSLAMPEALRAYLAKLSSDTEFSATASGEAVAGTYQVQVTSLAASESEESQGFADKDDAGTLQQGTYTVTYAGKAVDVTIDGTNDSLDGAAAAFDALEGVSAYVLDTGGTGSDRYKLVVQGDDTGAAHTISIASNVSGSGSKLTFTQKQAAADATLTVNGTTVKSASNSVTALPGITLDLKKAGGPAVTVTVERDDTAIADKVKAFVDKYNELVDYYDQNTVYNVEEGLKGALVGDATVRRAMEGLGQAISGKYAVGGAFAVLAELGIETQRDGRLAFDEEQFATAMEDYDDVEKLLTSTTGPIAKLQSLVDDVYVDEDGGTLSSRTETIEAQITDNEERIADQEQYLAKYSERLRAQFAALEATVARLQAAQSYIAALFA